MIFLLLLPISSMAVSAQDQLEMPSWELGWDEDMDGTYTLEVNNGDDIDDELMIFIDNQRMSDLNIELTIEWDSNDIPIDIDYPSLSPQIFSICFNNKNILLIIRSFNNLL